VARERSWTTPSDLAEYTFCPRAHYFRRHGEAPSSPASEAGVAYHARQLGSERWREEHPLAPWLAVVVGVGLLALAAVVLFR
jgi:CRISPR/Cas system-associated exonuclease Cas4 (RecB family)